VRNAYWHPLYDLYTTSENGKPTTAVSLHYRVNVRQHTGEDWTNTKLILSTSATDTLNAGVPELDNLIVRPTTPPPIMPPPPSFIPAPMIFHSAPQAVAPIITQPLGSIPPPPVTTGEERGGPAGFGRVYGQYNPVPPLPELVQNAAVISKSPMTISYTVEALTTIPSDGISHKVLVATIPLEAAITHIVSPRKSPMAYLQVM